MMQGREAEAAVAFEASIALNPSSALTRYNQGALLSQLGRPQEAGALGSPLGGRCHV